MHGDIDRLAKAKRYARYRKVDLHVHTPVSAWCWNQHRQNGNPPAGSLTSADVAEAILATDLDLVAITDHDTVDWVEEVSREVRRRARQSGRQISVLPGVEITTYDGVHLLGIFPSTKAVHELRNMLIRFGLKADGVVSERASSDWPLGKVAAEVAREGGLVIAPHALNPDMGIWGGAKSQHKGKRKNWLEDGRVRILACKEEQRAPLLSAIRSAGITRKFSLIRHSDAHSFEEIGVNATYVKLAELTIEGLRQVVHEPELRVSFVEPKTATHARLLGVELDGGYFRKELLAFSEHLNTLVGSNHAGKSAVVDAIRFAFDDPCFDDPVEQQRLLARIDGILNGGRVRVWLIGNDGETYRIDREAVIQRSGRHPREVLTAAIPPVITRIADDVEIPVDDCPPALLSIDFYGQGAVGRIAVAEESHRSLIDAMAGTATLAASLDPTSDERISVLSELDRNAIQTEEAEQLIEALCAELRTLPELKSQRDALQQQARSEIFASWTAWQAAERAVQRLEDVIEPLGNRAPGLPADEMLGELPELPSCGAEIDALTAPINDATAALKEGIRDASEALSKAVAAGVADVRGAIEAFRKSYDTQEQLIREQLATVRLTSQTALMKRIGEISAKIEELEGRTAARLAKAQQQLAELTSSRAAIMAQFKGEWDKLRAARRAFVDFLNGATGDEIHIELSPASDKTRYWKLLESIISAKSTRGASVQKRDREIQLLVEKLEPAALVELLLSRQADALAVATGVTANTAEFMCEQLATADKLSLLGVSLDDAVVIKYRREDEPSYTALSALSPGERALALLTVAFASTKGPIVIDQPEDELGQALVTNQLVETIRRRKQDRQFVIVTHNANIPVLGDAEGVFCLRNEYDSPRDARRCFVAAAGAIECIAVKDVLLGLEGGKDSFMQRQAKYNIAQGMLPS